MSDNTIRIVATDGQDTVTLGYISCGKQYVFGQVTDEGVDDPFHTTYHENGYMHVKWLASAPDPDNQPQYYGPSLDDFKGFVSGSITPISDNVGRIVSPDFDERERSYDSITYIDVRDSKYGMQYQPFICEPGFPVAKIIRAKMSDLPTDIDLSPNLNYQIYTETEPWVGVAQWRQASGINGLGASSNFRPMGIGVAAKANNDPYHTPCPNDEYGCDGPDGEGPLCKDCYDEIEN